MKSILNYYLAIQSLSSEILKILASQALLGLSNGIYGVLYNIYLKNLGYTEDIIGRLLSLQTVVSAISGLILSYFSNKIPKSRLLSLGSGLLSFGYYVISVKTSLTSFIAASFILGLGQGAIIVSVLPLLQEHSYRRQRPYVFSINYTILLLMNILAGFLAGWLPLIYKHKVNVLDTKKIELLSLQFVFKISAIIPIFAIFLGIIMHDKNKMYRVTNINKENNINSFDGTNGSKYNFYNLENKSYNKNYSVISIIREKISVDSTVIKFSLVSAIIGAGAGMTVPYFNLYFKEFLKVSIKEVGFLYSINQLGTAIGSFITPVISKKLSAPKGAILTISLSLPFLLVLAFMKNFYVCAIAYVVRGALMNMSTPMRQQTVMDFVNKEIRSKAIAWDSMSWNLFWALSMYFSGSIIRSYGFKYSFLITFVLYFSASVLYYLFFVRNSKKFDKLI